MIFKKIPKWKIKRFLKRIISAFIFFGILFSLSLPSFAITYPSDGVYNSFDSFVSDGEIDYLLRMSNDDISHRGTIYGASQNCNEMNLANNTAMFDSVRLTVRDSDYLVRSFSSGDSIVIRQFIAVYMKDGIVNPEYAKKFTFEVNYEYYDADNRLNYQNVISFRFKDCLKDYFYIEYDHGVSVFYDLEIVYPLPSTGGTIKSLDYHFYNIASSNFYFTIYPSYPPDGSSISAPFTYYVGPSSSAPIYSSPDGSSLSDLENAESNVLDQYSNIQEDFFNRFDEPGVTDFQSWANNFWPASGGSIGTWLAAASSLFSTIWNWLPWQINAVIKFLLLFGIFGFILNLVSSFWRSRYG